MKQKIRILLLAAGMIFGNVPTCFAAEIETEPSTEQSVTQIEAEELDLGDYQSSMEVGEKQLLTVTVLPMDTANQKVTYSSSDDSVASINGMGRITAIKAGTTTITVTCQEISEKFKLTVTEKSTESTEQVIAVSDIEIADHENELEVDKTMSLTAAILPANATETQVSYASDNPAVATVSSSGEVKGIAPGNVTITVMAGGISKTVPLTIKIAAYAITLSKSCVIVKCGDSQRVTAAVEPAGAAQTVTYRSKNPSVATVAEDGTITGQSVGNTTVIVSNGDMSNSITVIVNEENLTEINVKAGSQSLEIQEEYVHAEDDKRMRLLSSKDKVVVDAADYPVLTKDILKRLYEAKTTLQINAPEYTMQISGKDIENFENELCTKIEIKKEKGDLSFVVNEGKNLPGKIVLKFNQNNTMKYIFLYNPSKNKYEQLDINDVSHISVDTAGKYLLSQQKIHTLPIKLAYLTGAAGIFLVIAAVYIMIRKKYWFW